MNKHTPTSHNTTQSFTISLNTDVVANYTCPQQETTEDELYPGLGQMWSHPILDTTYCFCYTEHVVFNISYTWCDAFDDDVQYIYLHLYIANILCKQEIM